VFLFCDRLSLALLVFAIVVAGALGGLLNSAITHFNGIALNGPVQKP
jgi:hypothetical protein